MQRNGWMRVEWIAIGVTLLVVGIGARLASAQQPDRRDDAKRRHAAAMVIVPEEDRFTPFETTVFDGDRVDFINQDSDDHTIVSDDAVSDGGPRGVDMILEGTENNGGQPGKVSIVFGRPGTWVFYCRFHSHLDAHHQPVAPGPDGGIQDANGNYGTPMMGIVHVKARGGR